MEELYLVINSRIGVGDHLDVTTTDIVGAITASTASAREMLRDSMSSDAQVHIYKLTHIGEGKFVPSISFHALEDETSQLP